MDIFKYLNSLDLRAMTLVAARFRAVATSLLYHELSIGGWRICRLLASIKMNPHNATIIKCIQIWLEPKFTPPETWEQLFVVLTHTQNLERLYISPSCSMNEVEWYPPPMPRLQILEFRKLRMSAQLAESLVALPELKCLKLGLIPRHCTVAPNPYPASEHLTMIMNNLVEFEGSMTLTVYLRDYGKLRYLSTSYYDDMEEEWRLLPQVAGATLQFLRVRGVQIDSRHQFLSLASRFSALRFLGVIPLNITEPPPEMVRNIVFAVEARISIRLPIERSRS